MALELGRVQVRAVRPERGLEGRVAVAHLGPVRQVGDEEPPAASGRDAVQEAKRSLELDRRPQRVGQVAGSPHAVGIEAPFDHGARQIGPRPCEHLGLAPVPEVARIARRNVVGNRPQAEAQRRHLARREHPPHLDEPGEQRIEAAGGSALDVERGRRQVVREQDEDHGVGAEERRRVVDELEVVRELGSHHAEVHRLDAPARARGLRLEAARDRLLVAGHRTLDEAVAREEDARDPGLAGEAPLAIPEAVGVERMLEAGRVGRRLPDDAQAAERAARVARGAAHVVGAVQARDLGQREGEAERELLEHEDGGEPCREHRGPAHARAHRSAPHAARTGRAPPRDMVPRRGRSW